MEMAEEQLPFWQLVDTFIKAKNMQVLKIKMNDEVWLQEEGRKRTVFRFIMKAETANLEIQDDLKETEKKLEILRQELGVRAVTCHAVYVAKNAFTLPNGDLGKEWNGDYSKVKLVPFLLNKDNWESSIARLWERFKLKGSPMKKISINDIPQESKRKQALLDQWQKQKKVEADIDQFFSFGKPYITSLILCYLIVMFLLMERAGASTDSATLLVFGAKDNALIMGGEWWRLVTSMFLHIGIIHLVLNGVALFFLGGIVERVFGSARFLVIFLFSGLLGSIASFLFTMELAAGASGAIFGCFGAILFFGSRHREMFLQSFGYRFLMLLGVNIAVGFSLPFIDMAAHVGGLLGGFVAAYMVQLPDEGELEVTTSDFEDIRLRLEKPLSDAN